MNNDTFEQKFDSTLDSLRVESSENLTDFEHGVWTEIALHESRAQSTWRRWFQSDRPLFPMPVTAAFAAIAVTVGITLGMSKADAYDKAASQTMEQNYVSSIHPVLKSQNQP